MFKKNVSLSVVNNRIIMFWKNVSLLVVKTTKVAKLYLHLNPEQQKEHKIHMYPRHCVQEVGRCQETLADQPLVPRQHYSRPGHEEYIIRPRVYHTYEW